MDALLPVAFKVVGGTAGLLLLWYILYRGVLDARKKAGRAGIGGHPSRQVQVKGDAPLNTSAQVIQLRLCLRDDRRIWRCGAGSFSPPTKFKVSSLPRAGSAVMVTATVR